jgi:muramoyltetrapeptide carboxypeptidase
LRDNLKLFVGYSDITTLLTWMVGNGIAVLHGPMVAKDFATGSADTASFLAAVSGAPLEWEFPAGSSVSALREGIAEGILYGGCLSLLVQSLGTPYEILTDDKLLFIEDVNVYPYQIDRMLMHLKLAGKLDRVRGIIFGQFAASDAAEGTSIRRAIMRVLDGFDIPIVAGIPSGHVDQPIAPNAGAPGTPNKGNLTLPMGVQARLSATGTVTLRCDAATAR